MFTGQWLTVTRQWPWAHSQSWSPDLNRIKHLCRDLKIQGSLVDHPHGPTVDIIDLCPRRHIFSQWSLFTSPSRPNITSRPKSTAAGGRGTRFLLIPFTKDNSTQFMQKLFCGWRTHTDLPRFCLVFYMDQEEITKLCIYTHFNTTHRTKRSWEQI